MVQRENNRIDINIKLVCYYYQIASNIKSWQFTSFSKQKYLSLLYSSSCFKHCWVKSLDMNHVSDEIGRVPGGMAVGWTMALKPYRTMWCNKKENGTELKRMKRKKRSDKRITFFWWKGKEQNVEGQLALKWKILDSKMRLLKPMAKSITWCILDNVPKVIRLLTRLFPRVFCRFIKFFKIKANKCNVYSS